MVQEVVVVVAVVVVAWIMHIYNIHRGTLLDQMRLLDDHLVSLLRTKTFSEYDQASTSSKRTSKINATGDSVDRRGKALP